MQRLSRPMQSHLHDLLLHLSHAPQRPSIRVVTPPSLDDIVSPSTASVLQWLDSHLVEKRYAHLLQKDPFPLTRRERCLFALLLDSVKESPAELRIAGGWVRDKLLGRDSHDLDVAVRGIHGFHLAERLIQRAQQLGIIDGDKETTKDAVHYESNAAIAAAPRVGHIACNPAQSKHLETAIVTLLEVSLDIVHLRKETYANDSRIPTSTDFGTPKEDALRRDLTINALFYNINTGQVEDWTECGLQDLKLGHCRTPLAPKETLLDDPLRALRAIRFACRFEFQLDPAILEAARLSCVQEAVALKLSRERVGIEWQKMTAVDEDANKVLRAMSLLHLSDLHHLVYRLPDWIPNDGLPASQKKVLEQIQTEKEMIFLYSLITDKVAKQLSLSNVDLRLCLVTSPLFVYRHLESGNRPQSLIKRVVLESLKWPLKEANSMDHLVQHLSSIHEQVMKYKDYEPNLVIPCPERAEIGLQLRQWGVQWPAALVASLTCYLLEEYSFDWEKEMNLILPHYQHFMRIIKTLNLEEAILMKPCLNGHILMQRVLPAGSDKKQLPVWLDRVLTWQLAHQSDDTEQCITYLTK